MTTKYSTLLKVKKQKLEEVENELIKVQNKKIELHKEIKLILEDIEKIEIPVKGDFSKINISYTFLRNLQNDKEAKDRQILFLEEEIVKLQNLYKEANIESEKVNYLEEEELRRFIKIAKENEQKEIDEIANMLFSNQQISNIQ